MRAILGDVPSSSSNPSFLLAALLTPSCLRNSRCCCLKRDTFGAAGEGVGLVASLTTSLPKRKNRACYRWLSCVWPLARLTISISLRSCDTHSACRAPLSGGLKPRLFLQQLGDIVVHAGAMQAPTACPGLTAQNLLHHSYTYSPFVLGYYAGLAVSLSRCLFFVSHAMITS